MKAYGQRFVRRLRGFSKDNRGVTAVEFAMIAMPFFILISAILELGVIFFAGQLLDNATFDAARMVRTGQAQVSSMSKSKIEDLICDRMSGLLCTDRDRLFVEVKNYPSFKDLASAPPLVDSNKKFQPPTTFNLGSRSSVMMVRVVYKWPMVTNWIKDAMQDTADGDRLIISTAIFRNEPY
ncbi:TadE/TadG family type IV pilus assembly protein [Pseudovibrio exalbescens]|uniref:TadE-like domain-containing protein n=1 Tax=Pseudovibrio exalbescens TaxID=197461 RepID=A0A1U7JHJ7_9HYPH|nr:TadE/TadG family type IV pilus assembly protein [Pseudovibrio exalbescens]OKL44175.1 hypothetical protein A3843_07050 [Pseudovibrio exalbescens]